MFRANIAHFKCIASWLGLQPGEKVVVFPAYSNKRSICIVPESALTRNFEEQRQQVPIFAVVLPSNKRSYLLEEIDSQKAFKLTEA